MCGRQEWKSRSTLSLIFRSLICASDSALPIATIPVIYVPSVSFTLFGKAADQAIKC